mmetsp:Transcript_52895/g.118714  ORF Transcript_52895/g.118714 Transcript_52895/m.118714 type:complete len:131 (-) Transcript_52895:106-498(-)
MNKKDADPKRSCSLHPPGLLPTDSFYELRISGVQSPRKLTAVAARGESQLWELHTRRNSGRAELKSSCRGAIDPSAQLETSSREPRAGRLASIGTKLLAMAAVLMEVRQADQTHLGVGREILAHACLGSP